jgi:tRNA G37 N-methylase Trm5
VKIRVLDLFSGIGGFHLGLEKAGFEVESYFSEIDKYAIDVYSNNFKNSTYVGSVTTINSGTTCQESMPSLSDHLAKILAWLENEKEWTESDQALSLKQLGLSKNADHVFLSGKTLKEHSAQTIAKTLQQSCKRLPTLGVIDSNGNCLIQSGFYPKIERESTLSDILETEVKDKYFLSEKQWSE